MSSPKLGSKIEDTGEESPSEGISRKFNEDITIDVLKLAFKRAHADLRRAINIMVDIENTGKQDEESCENRRMALLSISNEMYQYQEEFINLYDYDRDAAINSHKPFIEPLQWL